MALSGRGILGALRAGLLGLCYPPHCGSCGLRLGSGEGVSGLLCTGCLEGIHPPASPCCRICSHPLVADNPCPNCAGRVWALEAIIPACRYSGVVRELLQRLKYGRDATLAAPLGDLLAGALAAERLGGIGFRALVPVPLYPVRQRERGFNQAELLARRLGPEAGIPVRTLVKRIRPTASQAGLDRDERMDNLRGAFVARRVEPGGDYLLVDDICTTGATLDACAIALKEAGAGRVFAVTVARG